MNEPRMETEGRPMLAKRHALLRLAQLACFGLFLGLFWSPLALADTSVTIDQAAGQPDPTNTSPIHFTAIFSDPVSGFDGADVEIGGTAGGDKLVVVSGGPTTFTVAVSGMTDGTVSATIPAGVAVDAAGNGNLASTSTDNTVTFNATAPSVTRFEETDAAVSYSPTGPWVTRGSDVATFSGGTAVSSEVPGETATFTFTGTAVSWIGLKCSMCGIASVSIDGGEASIVDTAGPTTPGTPGLTSEVVFSRSGLAAGMSHTMVITVTGNTSSGFFNIVVDAFDVTGAEGRPRPTTRIAQAAGQPDPTNTSPIHFTAVFSEPVSGFDGADVEIGGTAGGDKLVEVSGGPTTFTVAVSGMTDGTVSARIPAGVAQDAAGNGNLASTSTDNAVTFNATAPSVTRFEETDAAVSYSPTGPWVTRGSETATFSGGTAVSSEVPGETATFTFTGTAVSWIGLKCSMCGIASVSIDGGAASIVDTAGPTVPGTPGLTSEVVFSASGLTAGMSHTMVITVTGNTSSGFFHIVVDAFDVTGAEGGPRPTTRIEQTDPAVSYIGNWTVVDGDMRASGGWSYSGASEMGARATLSFTGTGVQWISGRSPITGIARVFLDGDFIVEVDTSATSEQARVVMFTMLELPPGDHTLAIEVTGEPSGSSLIVVDAFDVTP